MRKGKASFGKIVWQLLKEVYRHAPLKFIIMYGGFALSGLLFSVMVYFKAGVFDAVVDFTEGRANVSPVLMTLSALFLLEVFISSINAISNYIAETYDANMAKIISEKINAKLGKLPQVDFETPDKLDLIERAKQGGRYAMGFLNIAMDLIFMYAPVFVFMGVYLFLLKPILLLTLLFVFVPVLYTQWVKMRLMGKVELQTAPLRRAYSHYADCAVGRRAFKETRILGAFGYFRTLFKKTFFESESIRYQAELKSNLWEASARFVSILGYVGILYLLFANLKEGNITVGSFAAVLYTIDNLYKMLEEAVISRFGPMAMQYSKLASFYEFLELSELPSLRAETNDDADFKVLHFKEVSFAYPGCENVLKRVTFSVRKGERIAIVGINGSGKSTLTKLITGLLAPSEGEIIWEGLPNGQRPVKDFTQLFQKYQRYEMRLSDNIMLSHCEKPLDDASLLMVMNHVGLSMNETFPDGRETILSKEFGKVDLSGGQWQKLAMARSLHHEAPVVLLDEPTAAIDPIMEADIYRMFHKMMGERTSFVVTHRMGAIQYVDKILVLDQGCVNGFGTHEALISNNALYRKLRGEV